MEDALLFVALAAAIALGLFFVSRANEIFCISVRDGRTLLVRGTLPPSLHTALSDVVLRERVRRGTIRAVRGETHARIVTSGIDDGTTQRLRNVFGHHSVQKLRAAPIGPRNLGQWLGFAWLAWLLAGRR